MTYYLYKFSIVNEIQTKEGKCVCMCGLYTHPRLELLHISKYKQKNRTIICELLWYWDPITSQLETKN